MTDDKKTKRGKRIEFKPVDETMDVEQEIVKSIIEEQITHEVVLKENE